MPSDPELPDGKAEIRVYLYTGDENPAIVTIPLETDVAHAIVGAWRKSLPDELVDPAYDVFKPHRCRRGGK